MHIAIDYTPALRQHAGIGRYTRGLVAALAEIDRQNEYTLFCAGGAGALPAEPRWPPNFRTKTSRLSARWLGIAWHRLSLPLPAEWLAGTCAVFHSPDFTLPPLARAAGVVTVHDLSFLTVPQCADPGLRAYLEKVVPRSVARAQRVLADSESTGRDLVTLLGVPEGKITVVPAGISPRLRREEDPARLAAVRARYRLPDRFILSVGTLEPRKNFGRLIEAYRQLLGLGPRPQNLVIAGGPGWLFEETRAQATQPDLAGRVRLAGFVADADLPALYSLADLFVFPSLYEGFGIPPLEAMACGAPVVAADNSSLPEAVGDAGLLVPAEDVDSLARAMAQVLDDPGLAARLVEAGYRRCARFTWTAAAQKLLTAYQLAVS